MRQISKRFGATHALRHVDLQVDRGQVLALVGENGAGKSTLMKVLSGAMAPDSGIMELDGRPFHPSGPHDARQAGVAMIYQELNLVHDLTVEDNVMLGQECHLAGVLRHGEQRRRVLRALESLNHSDLDPRTPLRELSVAQRQVVEIARALVSRAKVIVFDEPTSSLTQQDVDRLFSVVRQLREQGLGIVYISHFLEEVRRACDDFVVLRDGQRAGSGSLASHHDREIVALMVGRDVEEFFPRVPHNPGATILKARVPGGSPSGSSADGTTGLEIRRGEILGIAGLVGAGRTELLRGLFGLDENIRGEVQLRGATITPNARRSIQAGLGMVSEDRKGEGLAQCLSIEDNMTLSRLAPYSLLGWLRRARRRKIVAQWMNTMSIRSRGADQEVRELSGGNQQKVAIARVLHQEADVLLLDEPTRGIDVGTKADIYRLIGQCAAAGKAIVFVSSYLKELLGICDRIAVMRRGRLIADRPTEQWTEETLLNCAVSGEGDRE